MTEFKKQSSESSTRDYRERFEFKLTVGNNIICQRYFRINNFNPKSLKSFELADTIRGCAATIEDDLKWKAQTYLEMYVPQMFKSVEEMNEFFAKPENAKRMSYGRGIVVRGSDTDYVWGKDNTPVPCAKFDEGEFSKWLTSDDFVTYKFAFCVDGREVCSTIWEGAYPKYVRNSIDLSNKRGKHEGEDVSRLSFEQYLDYKVVEGRSDLVYGLIKDICYVCSAPDASSYSTKTATEAETNGVVNDYYYGAIKYNNVPDYSLWLTPDGKLKPIKRK